MPRLLDVRCFLPLLLNLTGWRLLPFIKVLTGYPASILFNSASRTRLTPKTHLFTFFFYTLFSPHLAVVMLRSLWTMGLQVQGYFSYFLPVFPIILSNRRFHRDCHSNTIGFNRLGLIPSRLSIAISDCHTDRGRGQGWQSHIFMSGLSSIYDSSNEYLQDEAWTMLYTQRY